MVVVTEVNAVNAEMTVAVVDGTTIIMAVTAASITAAIAATSARIMIVTVEMISALSRVLSQGPLRLTRVTCAAAKNPKIIITDNRFVETCAARRTRKCAELSAHFLCPKNLIFKI